MKAAEAGQSEVVELLISLHANAEAKDDEGYQPEGRIPSLWPTTQVEGHHVGCYGWAAAHC